MLFCALMRDRSWPNYHLIPPAGLASYQHRDTAVLKMVSFSFHWEFYFPTLQQQTYNYIWIAMCFFFFFFLWSRVRRQRDKVASAIGTCTCLNPRVHISKTVGICPRIVILFPTNLTLWHPFITTWHWKSICQLFSSVCHIICNRFQSRSVQSKLLILLHKKKKTGKRPCLIESRPSWLSTQWSYIINTATSQADLPMPHSSLGIIVFVKTNFPTFEYNTKLLDYRNTEISQGKQVWFWKNAGLLAVFHMPLFFCLI